MPKTNTDKCKDYYARLRQDPQKWAEFLDKRAAYKRGKKPRCEPTASLGVNPDRCEPKEDPVASTPVPPTLTEEFRDEFYRRMGDATLDNDEAVKSALESLLKELGQ